MMEKVTREENCGERGCTEGDEDDFVTVWGSFLTNGITIITRFCNSMEQFSH